MCGARSCSRKKRKPPHSLRTKVWPRTNPNLSALFQNAFGVNVSVNTKTADRRYNARVGMFAIMIHRSSLILCRSSSSSSSSSWGDYLVWVYIQKFVPSLYRRTNAILSFGSPKDERLIRGHSALRSLGFAPLAPNEQASCAFWVLLCIVPHVNTGSHKPFAASRTFEQPMKGDRDGWRACLGQL
jgi:hypothetical protein